MGWINLAQVRLKYLAALNRAIHSHVISMRRTPWTAERLCPQGVSKDNSRPNVCGHEPRHSFSILSDDRSKASSKTMPPHSAIQSLLQWK